MRYIKGPSHEGPFLCCRPNRFKPNMQAIHGLFAKSLTEQMFQVTMITEWTGRQESAKSLAQLLRHEFQRRITQGQPNAQDFARLHID
ncbi:MAG: hypothetical protein M3R16_12400 [Pseudomonadota bacterium]|nr:hypothetical protein [Pseudomonadota bacterium]